ncbi:MAG TPA: transcription antitermination factor NusB, partial [Dongiaceae bacterium]|nr:transcription antitermination factor NusB [Dongiaceae bacterium]
MGLKRPEKGTVPFSARGVAFELLQAVLRRGRPLDEALAGHAGIARLTPRDRGFARMLTATTLRRLGQIDAVLDRCVTRPLPARAAAVRDLLRLGAAQLLFLGTPAHAAVDGTVELIARGGPEAAGFKGLANAVLRRIAGEGEAMLAETANPAVNTPAWLWRSWCAAYGEATAAAIAAAHLAEPPLDLTVKGDAAAWAARLGATVLPTGGLRRPLGGAIEELPGYAEGAWWVQDAAAALPARLLGPVAGLRVVDLCAAPGGKTAQLAAAGAEVTAVDRSAARLERLADNLSRLHLAARI